jgi:hypothetical protein
MNRGRNRRPAGQPGGDQSSNTRSGQDTAPRGPVLLPLARRCDWWELTPGTVEHPADVALSTGRFVRYGRVVLLPDVLIAELTANGHTVPAGPLVKRDDGRSLRACRWSA